MGSLELNVKTGLGNYLCLRSAFNGQPNCPLLARKTRKMRIEPIGVPSPRVSGFEGLCRSENPVMFHLNRLLASLGPHRKINPMGKLCLSEQGDRVRNTEIFKTKPITFVIAVC